MGDIIRINGFSRPLPVDYVRPPTADRCGRENPAVATSASGVGVTDEVELSALGHLLARMVETPEPVVGKVDRIRAAIAAGTYESPAKIAVVVERLLGPLEL